MRGDSPSDRLSIELEPKPEASASARQAIRGVFRDLPAASLHDLLAVVSELVMNAVQHGPGRPIALRVSLDPKREVILGEVVDQGEASQSMPRMREVVENHGGGYGLRIVDAMTSEWQVVEGSTSVRFEIPIEQR